MDTQKERQADRQADKQTDRKTETKTDRQLGRQRDTQIKDLGFRVQGHMTHIQQQPPTGTGDAPWSICLRGSPMSTTATIIAL